jgi:asparagine synthase (glutamine-hydrolysing)
MCGLTGYWGSKPGSHSIAERMASRIRSRGPDDGGIWIDDKA